MHNRDHGLEAGDRGRVFDLAEIGAEDGAVDRTRRDHLLQLIAFPVLEARLIDEHAQRVLDIGALVDQIADVLERRVDGVGRMLDQPPLDAALYGLLEQDEISLICRWPAESTASFSAIWSRMNFTSSVT